MHALCYCVVFFGLCFPCIGQVHVWCHTWAAVPRYGVWGDSEDVPSSACVRRLQLSHMYSRSCVREGTLNIHVCHLIVLLDEWKTLCNNIEGLSLWLYKMAAHGGNVVYSVWVVFVHFIRSNDQDLDIQLPLWHYHSGWYRLRFRPFCCCAGSFIRRNKEAPYHTFGGSLLDWTAVATEAQHYHTKNIWSSSLSFHGLCAQTWVSYFTEK